jgi:hypothetical protein
MDLLDRYLQAVKKFLPSRRQDDIIAELRANMESQLEDKESELGRPLTTGEFEDWLRQMGSPMLVAARYQPQQYLIGPAIFPIYWYVMRLALLWATVIYTVVTALVLALKTSGGTAVIDALFRVPGVLVSVATWVTFVFAIIEFATSRYPEKCPPMAGAAGPWSPSKLPPLEKEIASGKKPRSFTTAVAEVVFGFLFLGWLLLIPRHPFLLMGPGAFYLQASPFQLTQVWWTFFWLIVAVNIVQLSWRCLDLLRGKWQQSGRAQRIAITALSLIPFGQLLLVPDRNYVIIKHPELDQLRHAATLNSINQNIRLALLLVCAIVVLQLAWEISQLIRDAYRKRAAAQ